MDHPASPSPEGGAGQGQGARLLRFRADPVEAAGADAAGDCERLELLLRGGVPVYSDAERLLKVLGHASSRRGDDLSLCVFLRLFYYYYLFIYCGAPSLFDKINNSAAGRCDAERMWQLF